MARDPAIPSSPPSRRPAGPKGGRGTGPVTATPAPADLRKGDDPNTCAPVPASGGSTAVLDRAPFRIDPSKTLGEELKRLLLAQIDDALQSMQDYATDPVTATHRARRTLKRARSIIGLTRPAFGRRGRKVAHRLRNAGRFLAALRDADALAQTLQAIYHQSRDDGSNDGSMSRAGIAGAHHEGNAETIGEVEMLLHACRRDVLACEFGPDLPNVVARRMVRLYQRSRHDFRRARRSRKDAALHDWRKRIKDRWHAARLFSTCWPKGERRYEKRFRRLAEDIGKDHDLALLSAEIANARLPLDAREAAALAGKIAKRRKTLQRRALREGRRLYARPVRDIRTAWKKWARRQIRAQRKPRPADKSG